jgi:hypothetical protein
MPILYQDYNACNAIIGVDIRGSAERYLNNAYY